MAAIACALHLHVFQRAMVGAVATNMAYQALDNFWLFEYELQSMAFLRHNRQ
jgi:hypothetical protein